MGPQRYTRVAGDDTTPVDTQIESHSAIPSSPPPSFHSLTPPRRSSTQQTTTETEAERSLDDAFGGPHDSDDEEDESRRLVSRSQSVAEPDQRPQTQRRVTEFPSNPTGRVFGGGSSTRDGVFANISAKPTRGEELEEKPPTYEQAAADAAPPYWETTILTPAGYSSDDIFVDGLMVGSIFGFVWNALISMSFQLIGFLLTYLLHTTHAAKHGSRAGLGVTLIQYGFAMRNVLPSGSGDSVGGVVPADPNDHNFDPSKVGGEAAQRHGHSPGEWFGYALMISGWFLLIKSSSDFVRARRQEQLIRASPDRGLPVPIIAEGEGERAV